MHMFKKLMKVTAEKNSIIVSSIVGGLEILLLGVYFVLFFRLYRNPITTPKYLYSYGYGLYARDYCIVLASFIFVYAVVLFFFVRKRKYNITITAGLFLPIYIISGFASIVIFVKENRLNLSYTNDVANYGIYDEEIAEEMELLSVLLPEKSKVIRYEYFLHYNMSLWVNHYQGAVFLETDYEENVHAALLENEEIWMLMKTEDSLLEDFVVFYHDPDFSSLNRPEIRTVYVLVSDEEKRIIYAVENAHTNIFKKYNNLYNIGAFINGERNNPYFKYKAPKSENN